VINSAPRHPYVWENGDIAPCILNLGIWCRWVVSFTSQPHYARGKDADIHCIGSWVGLRAGLDAVAKRNTLPCRKSNPGRPVRSLVTLSTALSRSNKKKVSSSSIFYCIILTKGCKVWCCILAHNLDEIRPSLHLKFSHLLDENMPSPMSLKPEEENRLYGQHWKSKIPPTKTQKRRWNIKLILFETA
jgi:hypothetical protein